MYRGTQPPHQAREPPSGSQELRRLRRELTEARSALAEATAQVTTARAEIEQLTRQLRGLTADATSRTQALIKAKDDLRLMLEKQSAAKSRFIAEAAHDLRQPMQAIGDLLQATSLSLESEKLSVAQNCVADAMKAVSELRSSFNMVFDLSVLESGGVVPTYSNFDVRPLVEEIVRSIVPDAGSRSMANGLTRSCWRRSSGCEVEIRVWQRGSMAGIRSDRRLLRRILVNLVSNSIKYVDPSKPMGCKVLIAVLRLPQYIRLEVIDNGIGIPTEQTQTVFEPYVQLQNPDCDRDKGVGLGLAVVRAAVDLLREHRIEVRSLHGQWTRFSLELPLAEGPVDPEPDPAFVAESPSADLSSLYVLLISSDSLVRKGWEALLAGHGATLESVDSLESMATCLRALERHPDVVLTDYRLANGATAADVVRITRDILDTNVPMVILTGKLSNIGALDELRGARVLRKPIPSARLIEELVNAGQATR